MHVPVEFAFFQIKNKIQIFAHRHIGIKRRKFGQIAYILLRFVRFFENVVPVNGHRTRSERRIAGYHIHRRRFSRAVRTEKADYLAFFNRKRHVVDNGF